MTDTETIAVYDAKAQDYADSLTTREPNRHLAAFIHAVPQGGAVLDLGCGPGNAAAAMIDAGLKVTAIDPSIEMAKVAKDKYDVDVQIGTFENVIQTAQYDGIWVSFSLLHVPRMDAPRYLKAIHTALKPNGQLMIGVKTGDGEQRDKIGRKYTYFQPAELDTLLRDAGFTPLTAFEGAEEGLDGTIAPFIIVTAHA